MAQRAQSLERRERRERGAQRKALASSVMILCLSISTASHAQTADTLSNGGPLFRTSDAVLTGGFIAAAVLTAPADRWFTRSLQNEARQANRMLQVGSSTGRIWGNPGTLIASGGIYLIGTATGNRRVQDLGLHAGGAVVISNIITGGIKVIAGRARPYVDSSNARNFHPMRGLREQDYQSFPSGHSTAAFAFASVVSAETSHWWPDGRWPVGIATYGLATLTGMSRIYNYKHWASDVLVGAAIGTITGLKVFRYQHSHPDNRIDGTFLRAGLQSTGGHWNVIFSAVPR